jgi:chromosome partitioning protein
MMKKLAIVMQKGGVGKTMVAVNLAVAAQAAGVRTALFDLDTQESAAVWADRRQAEVPHVEFLTERRLPDALAAAEAQGFELAIIDTPPAAGPEAYTAAQAADLALIPCGTDLTDLDAIGRTAKLVKGIGIPAFVVFNKVPIGATTLLEDAQAIVNRSGLTVAPFSLRLRSAFRAAWPLGKGVIETEPGGKAAAEISELQEWVFAQLNMCTPDRVQATRKVANG